MLHHAVHGWGIVSIEEIAQGEPILVWGGASYTDKASAVEALRHNKAVMQWDDDVFSRKVDGDEEDSGCFMINRSCDPNAWMTDADTICARRDIGSGEEGSADFALWETDERYVSSCSCHCGSSLCRGRVTGADWKDPVLQERYRGHFSPYLNKRIDREPRVV